MNSLKEINFEVPGAIKHYHGKVREVYELENDKLMMIVSDRISAFDHILPKGIPFKGQVLNQLALRNMKATEDIVPNWIIASPDPNLSYGVKCEPFKVEMVIRGYCTGHAWREYFEGKRLLSGVAMPEGLRESDPFPEPIITPATKAEQGDHDEDISREDIIAKGIVSETDYLHLETYTRDLFQRGSELAAERGLILVDTKYEFGKDAEGVIRLIDEIHTPDSSRYFYANEYHERQERGLRQRQLSKEFVREWLLENGFQGMEGQIMPDMPESFVKQVSDRYIELYETLIGESFVPADTAQMDQRILNNIKEFFASL